jgi:hypothetical protein
MLLAGAAAGRAGETPGQKCTVTKLKAAFKKARAKGACYETAVAKAVTVNPLCLGKADAAFASAFQKAEAKGGCAITGDATPVEATVNACVSSVVNEVTGVTPGSIKCALGYLDCGGTCVNIATDPRNCGGCGVVCSASEGLVCLSGTCVCPPFDPITGYPITFCGTRCNVLPCRCANLFTDVDNCGSCGNACLAPQVCSRGVCTCPLNCGGTCVDPQNDPANCGACGNVCPPKAPQCAAGACETTTTTTTSTTTTTIIGPWHNFDLVTFSQAEWSCQSGQQRGQLICGSGGELLLTDYFTVYEATSGVLTVGLPTSGFSMVFDSPVSVFGYLPAVGPTGPLDQNLVDPTTTSSGVFGGDVVALKLNLDLSRLALIPGNTGLMIGNLTLCNMSTLSGLNGLTVSQVLPIANTLLGGGTASVSIADLDPVIEDINGSFDGGIVSAFAQEHLFNGACP